MLNGIDIYGRYVIHKDTTAEYVNHLGQDKLLEIKIYVKWFVLKK